MWWRGWQSRGGNTEWPVHNHKADLKCLETMEKNINLTALLRDRLLKKDATAVVVVVEQHLSIVSLYRSRKETCG